VACVESFNHSLKTFDFALYLNVDSNHVSSLCLSTKIVAVGDVAVRAYQEALGGGWLLCECGAGSREQGFLILIFKNSDNHGKGDLLPWIMKLWIF
jgi:hypothetical protein